MAETRAGKIREVIDRYESMPAGLTFDEDRLDIERLLDNPERYLLVERGHEKDGWLSTHADREAAGSYNVDQEYAEDWWPEELIDLDEDRRWTGSRHVVWIRVEPESAPDADR